MSAVVSGQQVEVARASSRRFATLWNALPFGVFAAAYVLIPRFADDGALTSLIYIGINVLLALGLNLLMGYAGQVSLGHAAYFGIGAYCSAILTVRPIPSEVIPGFSVGVGVMAGMAALISLTKVSGSRLAGGVGAMLVLSWVARLAHAHPILIIAVFAVGLAGFGAATGTGWRKGATCGVVAALAWQVCRWFLEGVLARGGTSPWTAMVVGIFVTGLVAYLVGGQVLRLKGHYLGMATLGFGVIVEIVFRQWTSVTGGSSDGIFGIPTIQVVDGLPGILKRMVQGLIGGEPDIRQQYFLLVWAVVFVALVLANNIVRSRVGRAFRAVHGSELAAESLGVDTERYKAQVFVLSAALASVAGSLHAHHAGVGYINPSEFGFIVSVQLVVMVVIGGLASVWGSLFGAAVMQVLRNALLNLDKSNHELFGLTLKGLDPIVFGGVLILVMMLVPQGLVRGGTDAFVKAWRTLTSARRKKAE